MTNVDKVLYTAKVNTTGTQGPGTNPEQLFAAGWPACFEGAMGVVAEADLCIADGAYFLKAGLNVSPPGLARNIDVAINVVNSRLTN
jgi:lipoyl-dependent peroxiredoxin